MSTPSPKLFRQEALESLKTGRSEGELLRLSPRWTKVSYWLVLAMALGGLSFAALASIDEYATGPAVVRADGRTELTAAAGGTVVAVEVQPGQRVSAGQLVARFYVAQEAAELERLKQEFDLQLLRLMRDPADQAARQSLTQLRAQKELAETRLDERSIRAPREAVVSDIRIRSGQLLQPGDVICSLVGEDARFSVLALVPAQYRPLIHAGMPLRLEMTGFRYRYRELVVDSIGDEVVGPSEVRRYLGQELGDAFSVAGPVVLVRATLPSRSFVFDGQNLSYYNGSGGVAEITVRRQSLLVTLIPALRALFEADHG